MVTYLTLPASQAQMLITYHDHEQELGNTNGTTKKFLGILGKMASNANWVLKAPVSVAVQNRLNNRCHSRISIQHHNRCNVICTIYSDLHCYLEHEKIALDNYTGPGARASLAII